MKGIGEEGRLYKELKAMRQSVTRGILHGQKINYEFTEKGVHAPFNEFWKTLDEARKEFPIVGWKAGISHSLSEEECQETYKWFEKWFGSSEVQK